MSSLFYAFRLRHLEKQAEKVSLSEILIDDTLPDGEVGRVLLVYKYPAALPKLKWLTRAVLRLHFTRTSQVDEHGFYEVTSPYLKKVRKVHFLHIIYHIINHEAIHMALMKNLNLEIARQFEEIPERQLSLNGM